MEKRHCRPAIVLLEPTEKILGWIYLPIYFLLLSLLLTFVFMLFGWNVLDHAAQLHMNAIYGAINFIALAIIFRRYLLKSARQVGLFPGRFFLAVFVGFLIYYFGTALMTILTNLIAPGLENVNDASLEAMADFGMGELAVFTILLAPLAEECLFRGLIFTSLRTHSRFLAYAVTIFVFSLIHVFGYLGSYSITELALCFWQYLPASFALAWAMEYSGSIWGSISVHILANAVATLGIALTQ